MLHVRITVLVTVSRVADCDLQTHFQCGNETSCLPLEKRCDGKIDCWDAADEINCTLGKIRATILVSLIRSIATRLERNVADSSIIDSSIYSG